MTDDQVPGAVLLEGFSEDELAWMAQGDELGRAQLCEVDLSEDADAVVDARRAGGLSLAWRSVRELAWRAVQQLASRSLRERAWRSVQRVPWRSVRSLAWRAVQKLASRSVRELAWRAVRDTWAKPRVRRWVAGGAVALVFMTAGLIVQSAFGSSDRPAVATTKPARDPQGPKAHAPALPAFHAEAPAILRAQPVSQERPPAHHPPRPLSTRRRHVGARRL